MLRTRLWMGSLLIGLAVLLLLEHDWFAPWYPFLFACYLAACLFASHELLGLLPKTVRPSEPLTFGFVTAIVGFNWWPAFQATRDVPAGLSTWNLIGACVVVGTMAA